MEAGKLAAEFLEEAIQVGNYGEHVMSHFQERWLYRFGSDFKW